MLRLIRLFVAGACWLPPLLQAAVPQLDLVRGNAVLNLAPLLATEVLSSDGLPDPQALWDRPAPPPGATPADKWLMHPGERLVGRAVLNIARERDDFVVVVPSSRIDLVQVWYRYEGGDSWKGALAGDLVAVTRWPFVGTFPAFHLHLGDKPMQLIVTAENSGTLAVPVLIEPDAAYREAQTRQAHISGLALGLGFMTVAVCLISGLTLGRAANWLLLATSCWAVWTMACMNGDAAIWLTPDWPAFNDASKHFSSVVLSSMLVTLTLAALDTRSTTRVERVLGWMAPALGLAFAVLQAVGLPPQWREAGATGWAVGCVLVCLAMCAVSAARGGNYVGLVASGAIGYGFAAAVNSMEVDVARGLDLRPGIVAVLLFGGLLVVRHGLFLRERHGRDVLGRAAISAHRDPLTALLSYTGFQEAFDTANLRLRAGHEGAAAMLLYMPGIEQSAQDHGFVLVERALVRLAASLQKVLGDAWHIGRLGRSRFACVSRGAMPPEALQAVATQLLAESARLAEPLAPVKDFDLRIAATQCTQKHAEVKDLLRELEAAATALETGKRIVIL